jgi:cation diffusion facilitator family transporter
MAMVSLAPDAGPLKNDTFDLPEAAVGMRVKRTSDTVQAMYRTASRTAAAGLAINLALGAVKLVGGIVGQSFALLSDAVNSIGDALGSAIVLFALRVAQKPPDLDHPYGHTRAEAVAGLSLAWLIAFSAVIVGWEAITHLADQHSLPAAWTLWIAAANVVIKEALYRVNKSIGDRLGSQSLVANAWDHRSDALCSLAVVIGVAAVRWGGPRFMWADEIAALVVVAAILWSAYRLLRNNAAELMDQQTDDATVDAIRRAALSVPGVRGVEKLLVRRSGMECFADIHIEVDPQVTVEQGHAIGHVVKAKLVREFTALRDVLVHLEPHPHTHDHTGQDGRTI